ncbi:unnamed protein product [Schistosoma mattheei]|uniref:Uncharacterized protein n=1 Tax=Schistosoma mattheei TaxID=31246 RepID=A0A3P8FHY6_9TREM|nr:unnamed protein product [Schistosoma mattheei]
MHYDDDYYYSMIIYHVQLMIYDLHLVDVVSIQLIHSILLYVNNLNPIHYLVCAILMHLNFL